MKVYTPLHKINCNPIQLTAWWFILIPSGSEAILAVVISETSWSPPNLPHQNGPSAIESHITYGVFDLGLLPLTKLTSW